MTKSCYGRAMRVAWWLAALTAVGCTKSNPAATCSDGTCSDPSFPFCDVDGSFGEPGTCIAVTCGPGTIGGCRGSDAELVCNAAGNDYDTQACTNGCVEPTGCAAPVTECTPNTTTCAGSDLLACDATGHGAPQACELGCSDTGGSHCKALVPSNNLQQFLDQTPNPNDLSLAGGTLDLDACTFTPTGGSATAINCNTLLRRTAERRSPCSSRTT